MRYHRGRIWGCRFEGLLLVIPNPLVDVGLEGRLLVSVNTRKLGETFSDGVEAGIGKRNIRTVVRKIVGLSKRVFLSFRNTRTWTKSILRRGSEGGNRVRSRGRTFEGRSYHVRKRVKAVSEFHLHDT